MLDLLSVDAGQMIPEKILDQFYQFKNQLRAKVRAKLAPLGYVWCTADLRLVS